jgi:hypothetical protein
MAGWIYTWKDRVNGWMVGLDWIGLDWIGGWKDGKDGWFDG